MFREIGSEFERMEPEYAVQSRWLPECEDECLTFSGRTAIETVLRDLGSVKKALLPGYCCDSMIEPFRAAGAEVRHYPVEPFFRGETALEIPEDCDVVLWCNYFGFRHGFPEAALQEFRSRGGIVIEDITHSLLSENQSHLCSDYLVASLRKWFPISSGGFCGKRRGRLRQKPQTQPTEEFLSLRGDAMERKKAYIDQGNTGDKGLFLQLYGQANALLARNYSDTAIDAGSQALLERQNVASIRRIRRENARILYQGLEKVPGVEPLFPVEWMDCPIFLPVRLAPQIRGMIRQKLTDAAIYCPIHWPRPNAECESPLYEQELSLICDQRYNPDDMNRMMEVLTD